MFFTSLLAFSLQEYHFESGTVNGFSSLLESFNTGNYLNNSMNKQTPSEYTSAL